jgi:hypothetical protein
MHNHPTSLGKKERQRDYLPPGRVPLAPPFPIISGVFALKNQHSHHRHVNEKRVHPNTILTYLSSININLISEFRSLLAHVKSQRFPDSRDVMIMKYSKEYTTASAKERKVPFYEKIASVCVGIMFIELRFSNDLQKAV